MSETVDPAVPGQEMKQPRYVTEKDFDAFTDKAGAADRTQRRWLGWMTFLVAILVIACAIQFKVDSYLLDKNEQLTKVNAEQNAQIASKTDLGTVTALVTKKTASIDTLQKRFNSFDNQLGFVRSKVNLVEGRVNGEDFATKDYVAKQYESVVEAYGRSHSELQGMLADSLAVNRAATSAMVQSFTAQQERSFQLLRSSVAADISSVKLTNRAALGLGIINTAWQAVHVSSNRK